MNDLVKFKEKFEASIKQNTSKQTLAFINNLNQMYHIDKVIIRQALLHYPNREQLQSNLQYQNLYHFFQYVLANQQSIELSYLNRTNQPIKQNNYQKNKNNIQKFLKDQTLHFINVFDKNCATISPQSKGINGKFITKFIKQLFDSAYTAIIFQGQQITSDIFENLMNLTIHNYVQSTKDIKQTFNIDKFWILQEEITQFLQFWISSENSINLLILYARTKARLEIQKKLHTNQQSDHKEASIGQQNHQFESSVQKIQIINKQQINEMQKIELNNNENDHKQLKQKEDEYSVKKDFVLKKQFLPKMSKQQWLDCKVDKLFSFGCKRRYPLPPGRTFQQIEAESKTMNLQKFINFANYFEFKQIISRQELSQKFKQCALNLRTIDKDRFVKLMKIITISYPILIDKIMKKQSPQEIIRKKNISNYKGTLTPIDGKSIQQLQQLIQVRKLLKEEKIKEKSNKQKKNRRFSLKPSAFKEQFKQQQKQQFQLNEMIDRSEDKFWEAYQAKIWSNKNKNILEAALENRMSKGNKVLSKFLRPLTKSPQ